MAYFDKFPLVAYGNLETGVGDVALTNILVRSAFIREILENTAIFYDYQVKEGETPEIIADKLYGTPNRFWIILMFNKLMNPLYDFPLTESEVNELIENKYGITAEIAKSTISHYETRITTTVLLNGAVQSSHEDRFVISEYEQSDSGLAVLRTDLPGTADTSIDTEITTEQFSSGISIVKKYSNWAISVYTKEFDENEKRRQIKLLDVTYVTAVENEFKRIMANG